MNQGHHDAAASDSRGLDAQEASAPVQWTGKVNPSDFGKSAGRVFKLDSIVFADFSRIEQLEARVTLSCGTVLDLFDIDALELAFAIKPTAVEGRRLQYARFSWLVHNVVGHPLMQLLALFKLYRWAFWIHDATAPKARGSRKPASHR